MGEQGIFGGKLEIMFGTGVAIVGADYVGVDGSSDDIGLGMVVPWIPSAVKSRITSDSIAKYACTVLCLMILPI